MSQNKQTKKPARRRYNFDDIGWSAIAFVSLLIIFYLMSYRSQIALKYLNFVDVFFGFLLTISIVSILMGVWRATLKWKYVNAALAVVWLVPFVLYAMLFAGPLFSTDINIPW